jgi:hypothetical protein
MEKIKGSEYFPNALYDTHGMYPMLVTNTISSLEVNKDD